MPRDAAPLLPLPKFVGVAEPLLEVPLAVPEPVAEPELLAVELPDTVVPKGVVEVELPEAPEAVREAEPDADVLAADEVDDALEEVEEIAAPILNEPLSANTWPMFEMFTACTV